MNTGYRDELRNIRTFPSLVRFLRDEMAWPIDTEDFEELTFDYTPEELGIDAENAAKISDIKRLRPLSPNQPWGVFFVKFEPRRLPVIALRRILGRLVFKKRASANSAERPAWALNDLLFISTYGEGDDRRICLAHFTEDQEMGNLATLNVLGWDGEDTGLHLDDVADKLTGNLSWPVNEDDAAAWSAAWAAAFTLRHREVITTSKALAERLAELARAIRVKVNSALSVETEHGKLRKMMKAFQQALIQDLDEDGFADMYAQTIAYGLLSARVSRQSGGLTADDARLIIPSTNPFLQELMGALLHLGGRVRSANGDALDFDELGINEVVETLRQANMEAVLRDFGDRNPQEDPVIHFYELFLKEYDAKKRMQRGVFYTPRPVVSYIVRSVDELLRAEFGLEDGLADTTTWGEMAAHHAGLAIPAGATPDQPFVQILDPAVGTGTFLVEVIDLIHRRMAKKWQAQGSGREEIHVLWNQYVPKSLLPRVHGYELLMAPYAIAHLKIGLKLYETGYRFASDERARVYLTNSLEPPSDVQLTASILPALAHEAQAVNEIKRNQRFSVVIGNPPYANFGQLNKIPFILGLLGDYKRGLDEKKLNLDDDFIKFVRFSQYVLDSTGVGVLGFITNNVFFDGITHRQMRQSLMRSFRSIWTMNLHGSAKRSESSPDGSRDENVFDIVIGVGITLSLKGIGQSGRVFGADMWGSRAAKYRVLTGTILNSTDWNQLATFPPHFFFVNRNLQGSDEYSLFVRLDAAFGTFGNGIGTDRDSLFYDFDKNCLRERVRHFFSAKGVLPPFAAEYGVQDSSSYALLARRQAAKYSDACIRKCLYRPFDIRWLYYDPGLTSRPAFDVMRHCDGTVGLLVTRQISTGEFRHVFITHSLTDRDPLSLATRERTQVFPLYLQNTALPVGRGTSSNLRPAFVKKFVTALEYDEPKSTRDLPEKILDYCYGVLHSPTYRQRYVEFLKVELPRIPVPVSRELFQRLSGFGKELISLHLMESVRLHAVMTRWQGSEPSGEIERISYSEMAVWIDRARTEGFRGVPKGVWEFQIGGYQVCEKWLKDRKGRSLSKDDIEHYQKIVVALAETIRIMKEIDDVIEQCGGWPGAFAQTEAPAAEEEPAEKDEAAQATPNDGGEPAEPETELLPLFREQPAVIEKKRTREEKKTPVDKVALDETSREELLCVVRQRFSDGAVRERETAVIELARELGFQRTSKRIRDELNRVLFTAVLRGILENRKNNLVLLTRSIEDYDRDFLKGQFLASLRGSRWVEREDAIRAFARWMGYRRTGSSIAEASQSLMRGLLIEGRLERDGDRIRRAP